jgi:hypothetical protein
MNRDIAHTTLALFSNGDIRARRRVYGRASSPLGPVESEPRGSRAMVSTRLHSGLSMARRWGSNLLLYKTSLICLYPSADSRDRLLPQIPRLRYAYLGLIRMIA